ncbi:MAG: hypothetical protein SAK29_42485, partial [Scytonema sp. PMC 1069.18]|nr:hypothetical protein [Scytonema sp. PMC 1069.18]
MSKVEAAMWIGVWAAIAQLAFVLVNDRLLSQRKLERRSIEKLRSRLSSRSQPATFSHITRTERFFSLSVLLVLFYTVFGYSLTTTKTNFWLWALAVTVYHWNLVYLVTNGIFKNRTTEKQNCILIITELTSMGIAFFMLFWLSKILPIYAIVVVVVSAVVSLQMLISLLRKPLGTYKTVIISESLAAVGLVLGSVAQRSLS